MLSARPSRCDRSTARPDALVCPSVSSGTGSSSPPSRTRADGLRIPAESAMPIRPGCGDSRQGRARRPSRPPARCLRLSSRSRPPKPEHPTRHRPRVPRRTQFPAVPDARAEPDPITEPEWPAKPEFARQARAELRRPPHRQWPAHRAATEHVTACLSGVRSGDEDDPVPGSLLGRAGRTARQPGRMAAPWPKCGRRTAGPDRPDRPPDRPQPLNHSAIGRAIRLFRAPAARTECSIWMLDSQRIPAFRSAQNGGYMRIGSERR